MPLKEKDISNELTSFKYLDAKNQMLKVIFENIKQNKPIDELKQSILKEACNFFNANRAIIQDKLEDLNNNYEYITDPQEKRMTGIDLNRESIKYWENIVFEKKLELIIPNPEEYIIKNNLKNSDIESFMREFNFKACISIPIILDNKVFGVFTLYFPHKIDYLSSLDIEFARIIAYQTGLAIFNHNLQENLVQTAGRERLLRNITDKIRNSFDINEIKKTIVTEAAKAFKADRCIIREFNNSKSQFLPVDEHSEYLSSPTEKSMVGVCPSNIGLDVIKKEYFEKSILVAEDFKEYLKERNLDRSKCVKLHSEYDMKSVLGINIYYSNHLFGIIVIQYTKDNVKIDEDMISLLRVIADQAGLAIYRAKLFRAIKQNNRREKLLRKITNEARTSSNVDNFLASAFNLIAKEFNIKFIITLEREIFDDSIIINEYKTSKSLNSLKNTDKADMFGNYFSKILIENKKNLIRNDIKSSDFPDDIKELCHLSGVNSILGAPFKINNDKWGGIILIDSDSSRKWSGFDINLIRQATENIYNSKTQSNLSDKSHLISNIAHEIRTPLSLINGYSEAISNELANKTEELDFYIDGIRNNGNRINEIISNFIHISQIEEEYRANKIQFYDHLLEEIIHFSIQNCIEIAEAHNVEIIVDCDADIIAKVNVLLIEQAISNLILQSIKYCEPSDNILIHAYQNSDETIINFNFTRNQKVISINLDLSLMQMIAGVHKGFIQINKDQSTGNIFSIHLPRK